MTDYREYKMDMKEKEICIAISGVISGLISYLFYRSIYAAGIFVIIVPIVWREGTVFCITKRKEQLTLQFKECIHMIVSSLNAGYSLENAFIEANKDCIVMYGADALMSMELKYINGQVKLNVPIEKILMDFAKRSDIEEILSFCEVFQFAKRSGGDFIKILKNTASKISESIEVKNEIETMTASKKMEQSVMNVMPFGILLYIDVSSPGFLSALYHNVIGVAVMSACLLVYVAAYFLSRKIVDIQI